MTNGGVQVDAADADALEAALAGGVDLDEALPKLGYARGVAAE